MKLYLDDVRPAPEGWVLARSVDEAMNILMKSGSLYELSLDFDLGMTTAHCETCDNRGWGRMYDFKHPDWCPDCSHEIVTNDESAPTGVMLLYRIMEKLDEKDHIRTSLSLWMPRKIYIHSANPVGRSTMQWVVRDMQKKYGREWPEAFR